MVVTTMAKIISLVEKIKSSGILASLSHLVSLEEGVGFSWQHATRTITYDPKDPNADVFLLHEIGHALLDHHDYSYDVHLLEMERAAWDKAKAISKQFAVTIDSDTIEEALDSYRDWLHARSLCPRCGSTGVQDGHHIYACLACHREWRANEARTCQLRRYHTKKRS